MDFTKTSCDGCSKPFENGDDIVVCPVCGTPQHRHCFESAGGCVNAAKHELGFEYKAPAAVFGEPKDEKAIDETDRADLNFRKEEIDMRVNSSLRDGELPKVDDVIEQRVAAICPGITPEQREEHICGADIGLASSFVGNNAPRYINKFRKREQTGRSTFNWAAFAFAPYWFFWRKLYHIGVVFSALEIAVTMYMTYLIQPVLPIYESFATGAAQTLSEADQTAFMTAGLKLLPLYAVLIIMHILSGVFADRKYHDYCVKSINDFKQIRIEEENETALKFFLSKSSTSFVTTLLSIIAVQGLPTLLMNILSRFS